jgi:hypothetical protein
MKSEQHARAGPTGIVATTRFDAGSIRETLGPPLFATQTAPGETAIDTRDRVVGRVGNPHGAIAGSGLAACLRELWARLARFDLDPSDDGVPLWVDPEQRRDGVAHHPDGSFAYREPTTSLRDVDSRDDLSGTRMDGVA